MARFLFSEDRLSMLGRDKGCVFQPDALYLCRNRDMNLVWSQNQSLHSFDLPKSIRLQKERKLCSVSMCWTPVKKNGNYFHTSSRRRVGLYFQQSKRLPTIPCLPFSKPRLKQLVWLLGRGRDYFSSEEPTKAYSSQQLLHIDVPHSSKSCFVNVLSVINNMSLNQ